MCWLLRGVGCSMPWLPWSCVLPTDATRFPASTLPFLRHCISTYWILLWVVCYVSGVNTMVCLSLRSLAFTPRTYLHGGIAPLSASGATHGSFCPALSEFSFPRRCRWFFLCFPWTCYKWYIQLAAGDPWIQWTNFATSIFRWLRGAYHMQQSFLAYAASWMVPLASLGGLMLLVFWAEVVHCSLHVLYAVLMPGKLLWAPTVSAWAWLSQLLCHCLMTCRIALELILRAVAVESLRLQGLLRRPRMDPPWKSQLRWRQEGVPDLGECACGLEPPCIERGLHVDHRHRDRSVTLPFLGQLRRLKKLLRRDPNAAPSTRMRLYGERMPGDAAWSLSGLVRIAALEERPWRGTEPRTERLPLLKWLAQRRPGNRRTLRRILSRRTFDEMSKDAGWRIPPLRCLRSLLGLRRRLVMHHLHGPHDLLKMREKVKRRKEQRMRTIMNRLAFAVRTPATMAWGLACKLKTDLMAMAGLENFRMQGWILYVHAALLPGLSYYMIVMIRQVLYLLLPVNIQLNTHDVRGWWCCLASLFVLAHTPQSRPTHCSDQTSATTTRTTWSRVGPKSHGCGCLSSKLCFSMLFWLLLISMFTHGYAAAADARVAPIVHQGAGASGLSWGEANGRTAHLSEVRTTVSPGLHNRRTVHQNNVRKRAFARALRRASVATDHSTIYRGRRCVLQGHRFQVQESRQRQHRLSQGGPTRRSVRARVRALTINLGGLDATTFDTFMAWLPSSPYEVICLQEIHFGLGRDSNSWVSAGWRFVTTVDPSTRFQGVAILVREALCRTGELHYQEVVPGRLLHVRVEQEHHSLDILGVYQHALHLEAGKNNLPQRQKVWDKLGALLHNLSRRNMLVLLGDYNCTPEYVTGAMGHSYDKASNYPDANEFAALLESHDLVLLNGWVRRSQQFTFTGSKHKSIIDFVITRRHHADGQARKARTVPGRLNFSPWRLGGRHLAVGATLPLHRGWTSTSRRHPPEGSKYDKLQLDHEARHGGPRIAALRTAVQEYLAGRPAATLEQINAHMLSQVIRLFPRRSEAPEPRAWNTPQVRGSVTAMWQARARLRNIWSTTYTRLRFSMEAFKRYRAFMQAYRFLKQQGRQARRTLLTNELAAAAEAAQRNDTGQLHRIIRRLAPKSKRVQVRIHGPNGEMLRDSAEHEAIVSYFEDLFQSQTAPLPINPGLDAAPQVSEQEVYDSLRSTKYGKAVPPTSTPSSAIKCCADILAQAITPAVNECLQGGGTPPR